GKKTAPPDGPARPSLAPTCSAGPARWHAGCFMTPPFGRPARPMTPATVPPRSRNPAWARPPEPAAVGFPPPGRRPGAPPSPAGPPADATDLLRQMLTVQQEHLAFAKASQDAGARWRTVLSRWQGDFPGLPEACKHVLPLLERAYIDLVAELTNHVKDQTDALANEYTLAEFLDRYGVRLNQLSTLLNVVGPIAEGASQETGTPGKL